MREISQLIDARLAPYLERVAELEAEVEELHRRQRNQGRAGVIEAVDHKARRIRVRHGDNLTPWIRYGEASAGNVRESMSPAIGEQVVLTNVAGGDDGAQMMAQRGFNTDQYPATTDRGDLHRREYPDGTAFEYDYAAHRLRWEIGPTTITGDRDQIELVSNGSTLTLDAAGIHLNGKLIDSTARAIQLNGPTTNQGGITTTNGSMMRSTGGIQTDKDVVASGVSLVNHTHREQGDGNSTSKPE